jgi:hypothetical protein
MAFGMVLGLAIGSIIGVLLGDPRRYGMIGFSLGMGIGIFIDYRRGKRLSRTE